MGGISVGKSLHKEWYWGVWKLVFDRYSDGKEHLIFYNTKSNISLVFNKDRRNFPVLYDGENDKECELPETFIRDMIREWS